MWARVPILLLAALALPGSAAPRSRSLADISLVFQDLGPVLTGFSENGPPPAPTAALLPDGRIRLYYASFVPGNPDASGIFSAVSADGLHFTAEPDRRWPSENAHIERLPDGRWRLYYTERDTSGAPLGIASAISTDGLVFTPEPGLRIANPLPGITRLRLSCCGIVKLGDGRYRMYFSAQQGFGPGNPPGPPQVYSAVSSDLFDWTLEPGIRLIAQAPAALANPDGSIMVVFGRTGSAEMKTAASPDGLTFGSPKKTNLTDPTAVGDPAFVTLPDGRLLMYYDNDRGMIGAAIAVRLTAPAVSYPSPAATAITTTSARVSGIIDPHGAMTTYAFEYGASTEYDEGTPLSDLPETSGPQTVSATLVGLRPATTYHFRLDAYNSVGTTNGADQTFTTAGCRLSPARDRGWEVALAHATTRTAAASMLRRAHKVARGTVLVERDGCTDYEAAIAGLTRKSSATALRRAKKLGFRRAAVERT
jgi:hypothetical protein